MTPTQYKKAAIALCRKFNPTAEKVWDENWHEFTYDGWRVGLHLRHHLKQVKTWTSDWISIGILNPYELPPFCDHWKWNLHYSGGDSVAALRVETLKGLERRLNRLQEYYAQPTISREIVTQTPP